MLHDKPAAASLHNPNNDRRLCQQEKMQVIMQQRCQPHSKIKTAEVTEEYVYKSL